MNNNIIKMRVRYLCRHPFIYALLYLLAACTNELEISGDHGMSSETSKIPIDLTAKLAGENATISKVRVIIFSTRSSVPDDPKVLVTNEEIRANTTAEIETYVGYNDIYVIGNEPTKLTSKLASIKTPQELKAILIETNENATLADAVLFQQLLNVRIINRAKIEIDGKTVKKLDIKLQHVMAKLSVDFDLDTRIKLNGVVLNVPFVFESMEIANIPKHSGLIPQIYKTTQGYMENRNFVLTKNATTQNNHFTWSSGDIFLPEHLVDNDTYKTILLIKGKAEGVSHTYTVSIGDSINPQDSKSDKWNVTRNRHYKLTIKAIKGYGIESLETSASVANWSEQDVPIEIPGSSFITLTKQEIEVKSLRFPTYARFISSGPVTFEYPSGLIANQMTVKIQYDNEKKNSGRIEISKGNWFTKEQDTIINMKVITGTTSINIKMTLTAMKRKQMEEKVDWATAMGYDPKGDANNKRVGMYNRALYKQAKEKGLSTGCNDYFEGDSTSTTTGKGCWRLATIRENRFFIKGGLGWCIEEWDEKIDGEKDKAYTEAYKFSGNDKKTKPYPYVCVLDVLPPELADFIVSDTDNPNITKEAAVKICEEMTGGSWRLPNGKEMEYVFNYAGTNGLPNNFFADSYWGLNNKGEFIVATMKDPNGSKTTDELRMGKHAVRCLKSRY